MKQVENKKDVVPPTVGALLKEVLAEPTGGSPIATRKRVSSPDLANKQMEKSIAAFCKTISHDDANSQPEKISPCFIPHLSRKTPLYYKNQQLVNGLHM